jgi:hypothetical protein
MRSTHNRPRLINPPQQFPPKLRSPQRKRIKLLLIQPPRPLQRIRNAHQTRKLRPRVRNLVLVDTKRLFEKVVRLVGEGNCVGDLGCKEILSEGCFGGGGDGAEKVRYRLVDKLECCRNLGLPIIILQSTNVFLGVREGV